MGIAWIVNSWRYCRNSSPLITISLFQRFTSQSLPVSNDTIESRESLPDLTHDRSLISA